MSQPMIVWCAIAGVLLLAFMFRAFGRFYTAVHHNGDKPVHHHLFELGKEREMFFIPGDADDDDDEDL